MKLDEWKSFTLNINSENIEFINDDNKINDLGIVN